MAFVVAGSVLAGCRDAPTDPMVGLVAEDAHAALALGVSFPDPASWAEPGALSHEGHRAMDRWQTSWDLPVEEGRAAREATYVPLVEALAVQLTAEEVERELALLAEGVLRARGLGLDTPPPHVAAGVERAVEAASAARRALLSGDPELALESVIRGGDALREVGPEAVARALQSEVETGLGRISGGDPYPVEELERLRRLVRGGRQAVEEGAWGLAIRRAFYAKALLDGNG